VSVQAGTPRCSQAARKACKTAGPVTRAKSGVKGLLHDLGWKEEGSPPRSSSAKSPNRQLSLSGPPEDSAEFWRHPTVSRSGRGRIFVTFTRRHWQRRARHLVITGARIAKLLMIVSSARTIRLADGSDHPTG
jgi:hypothetical protein